MKVFHKKCDNIMGTLSIIKTTKGMRFGGYTNNIGMVLKVEQVEKTLKIYVFVFH